MTTTSIRFSLPFALVAVAESGKRDVGCGFETEFRSVSLRVVFLTDDMLQDRDISEKMG